MDDQEARLRGLQEELSNVNSLVDHVGWKELMVFAQEQVALRVPGVLGKMESLFDFPSQEFEKGEIAGIQLFCNLPAVRKESLEQDIGSIEEELDYDSSERTTSGDGDASEVSGGTEDGGAFEPPT